MKRPRSFPWFFLMSVLALAAAGFVTAGPPVSTASAAPSDRWLEVQPSCCGDAGALVGLAGAWPEGVEAVLEVDRLPLGGVDLTMTQTTPTSFFIDSTLGVGDVVSVTVDGVTKEIVVEPFSVEWILSDTDEVHGLAPDGRTVEVTANPGPFGQTLAVVATGGVWTVDFTGVFDIQEQDPSAPAPPAALVNARIVEGGEFADGDALNHGRTANTPTVNVYPDCCGGQALVQTGGWRNGTLVTLDVLRGATTLLHKTVTYTGSPPELTNGDLAPLQVGDVVRVSAFGLTKEVTVVPLTITSVNPATDTVIGMAPTGATVEVSVVVPNPPPPYVMTTADVSDRWTAVFATFDLLATHQVNARVIDAERDSVGAIYFPQPPDYIIVSPNMNLIDGQQVQLTATGWPTTAESPGRMLFVTQCAIGTGGTDPSCDPTTLQTYQLNPDGTLPPVQFPVKEALNITWPNNPTAWSCTTSPCGLRGAVYPSDDPTQPWEMMELPGMNTVNFGQQPPQPGNIVVWPNMNLIDGQQVQLTATGWPTTAESPGRMLFVTQCAFGDGGSDRSCDPTTLRSYPLNPDGSLPPVQFPVKETVNITWPGNPPAWSCTTLPCGLRGAVYPNDDPSQPWQMMELPGQNTVNFGQQPPQPDKLTVTPNMGLVDGQQVQLTATGWPTTASSPGRMLFVTQCAVGDGGSDRSCDPTTLRSYPLNPDGSLPPVQFPVKETVNITWPNNPPAWSCTTSPCGLRGAVYPNDDPSQPWQVMELPGQNMVSFGQGPPQQPSFIVLPPNGFFGSGGWPNGETVLVKIDDPATPLDPDFSATSSIVGQPCPPGPCGSGQFGVVIDPYVIKAGDEVSAEVVGNPLVRVTHVVQPLSVTEVDYLNDRVTGTARSGSTVTVGVSFQATRTPTAVGLPGEIGTWVADFRQQPAYPLSTSDSIYVSVQNQGASTMVIVGPAPAGPVSMTPVPDTELTNGQTITLSGSNWPDSRTVQVTMCNLYMVFSPEACDPNTTQEIPIGPDGTFTWPYQITRMLTLGTEPNQYTFDCGAVVSRCGLVGVVFQIAIDYPHRNPLSFAGALPGPTISGTVLGDGGTVVPDTGASACPGTTWDPGCMFGQGMVAGNDGHFTISLPADLPPNNVWTIVGAAFDSTARPTASLTPAVTMATAPGETYTCVFTIGSTPSASCSIADGDGDDDGVAGSVEDAVNTAGDGNGDGTLDSLQDNVTSLPNAVDDDQFVTIASPLGTTLAYVEAIDPASLPVEGQPTNLPVGVLSFDVLVANRGDTASVVLYLPTGVEANAYFKYHNNTWSQFAGASFVGNRVTLTLVDGGAGDADGIANGVIVDPGAPADVFDFTGFFSPVDNPPVRNTVRAGRAIPVNFGLGGEQGLDIFSEGYPKSRAIACDTQAPSDAIEITIATAGKSVLTYDAATDRYQFVWKTDMTWKGCRQLTLRLSDGTTHFAIVDFR